MIKILRRLSLLVVIISLLSLYSFIIYRIGQGHRIGALTEPLKSYASFPGLAKDVLVDKYFMFGVPPTYRKKDNSFEEVNKLDYNLYGLNSFWNYEEKRWDIKLFNFRTDEVIHEWRFGKENLIFDKTQYEFPNAEVRNCLLGRDRSIIAVNDETPNMTKLDANSKVVWQNQEMVFHHSLNFDADSNIWVCASLIPEVNGQIPMGGLVQNLDDKVMSFREDFITKIDRNSGKILYRKGVSEILIDNGYKNFVYGFNNPADFEFDPIHLNDIQPVLKDGPYWQKGDVFISSRHRSLVMLYRPSTNEIIRLIFGPLLNQHDVDIINDSTISIFNNNVSTSSSMLYGSDVTDDIDRLNASEIIEYRFADSSFSTIYNNYMLEAKIRTASQGFHEILSNGDMYVEAENNGKIYVIGKEGFKLKKVFSTPVEGYIERPHWIRVFETLNLN